MWTVARNNRSELFKLKVLGQFNSQQLTALMRLLFHVARVVDYTPLLYFIYTSPRVISPELISRLQTYKLESKRKVSFEKDIKI